MSRRRIIVIIIAVVVVIVGVVAGVFALTSGSSPQPSPSASAAVSPSPSPSPTPEESDPAPSASAAPSDSVEPTPTPTVSPSSPSSLPTVDVTLSRAVGVAGGVQVNAYAATIVEGGSCSLALTRGAQTLTSGADAFADATTTICGALDIPTGVSPGTWTAVVTFTSPASEGTSDPIQIEVP